MRRVLTLIALLALVPVAEAQTPAAEKPRPEPARQTRDPASDPTLASPSLQRIRRPVEIGGGAACRTRCSQAYYFCLAEGDYACGGQWSQCLAGCPRRSSEP